MTNLLLHIFLPGEMSRPAVGRLSGIVGIVCNLLLFALKLTVGSISGSLSISADAMNNLSDASSSIVTLLGFKLSEKPADEDHPYGHARFEYLSGLAVAALIVIIGFELLKTSIGKIISPTPTEFSIPVALVLVGSILMKLWLSLFNRKLGKRIESPALLATAADSRNDCLSTAAVLIAALVEHLTRWHIDGWMGLLVAIFILYSGCAMAKDTISPLLGESASPELRQLIADTVCAEPKVLGYHDLLVHDYGPGQRFATLHVEMDYREDPLVCHGLIDNLERACMERHNVHLVIHYDPVIVGNVELDAMRTRVEAILNTIDSRLRIHDFRMAKNDAHTKLIFDMEVPSDLMNEKSSIKQHLDAKLNTGDSTYYTVITFDTASL